MHSTMDISNHQMHTWSNSTRDQLPLFSLKKRCFFPDDRFLNEGNIVCRWLRERDNSSCTLDMNNSECRPINIVCQIHACSEQFSDLSSYEEHYASKHRNICHTCGKLLPSNHLLDIHITENHDPLFNILSTKSSAYRCLVVGCSSKFMTFSQRKRHLIEQHRYPSSYRFDRKPGKRAKSQTKSNDLMDTSEAKDASRGKTTSRFKYSCSVPQTLCFGHGAQRTFVRPKTSRHGNHLTGHKQSLSNTNRTEMDSVDMQDLAQALSE